MSKKGFVDPQSSNKTGLAGLLETLLRRFKNLMHLLLVLPFYGLACFVVGLAIAPGLMVFNLLRTWANEHLSGLFWYISIGIGVATAYFIYGLAMVLIVPFFNFILVQRLYAWRGPYYSVEAIKWYIHNGATYILRYTFLELVTPSPISLLFYRLMGMKIKKGAVINTTHISDPSLIEIGEESTIGGSAVLIGHYGQSGFLILAPTKIGRRVNIGLRAVIMGGVTIGDNAKVLANSVVLPKTIIPENETWGGVPAHKL